MKPSTEKRILAERNSSDFVGRQPELERLLGHARGEDGATGLVLLAPPGAGTSELLRQTFDRLFHAAGDVIPFFFELKARDGSIRNTALRFVTEFLAQTVAFRRGDPTVLRSSPELSEIAELALPSDCQWVDRLVETLQADNKVDDRSFVRNCLSAPLRAARSGVNNFVMIDGLHVAGQIPGGEAFIADLSEVFTHAELPFVFAGHRRFLYAKLPWASMSIHRLSFADAGRVAERFAVKTNVTINDQTRDLIAVQLGGQPNLIGSLFATAAEKNTALNSFERVQAVYTDEIFGGRIGRYFDASFGRVCPDDEMRSRVFRVLGESLSCDSGRMPLAYWKKRIGQTNGELEIVLRRMHDEEIVNIESGSVRFDSADTAIGDYVQGRATLASQKVSRALVVGETLSANVKRASALMARHYRKHSAIGLRELMRAFDGRSISPAMIDYERFKAELKGANDEKILTAFAEDNAKTPLPQIVYTAHLVALYPKLNELADAERSAVALGLQPGAERQEVVWIAAEIESKLEATRDITEFWCDRLEMVAAHCNFSHAQLWLVAPEGFAPDAIEVLRERNAYGSSRKQAEMLARLLNAAVKTVDPLSADEYEIIVPMGEDAEMIAAHTIEDIAKRHGIPSKTINQIKTALVEACINATEHSLSPDRKIYQKFVVEPEKITITIANRGLRLADKNAREITTETGRRGWGLKLMKGLMDDVKIDQTDDGTRVTMTKFLTAAT